MLADRTKRGLSMLQKDLSVIVPLYNEEENIDPLFSAITEALSETGLDYEVLFVDDGSGDSTFERAAQIARDNGRLRVVRLRRNYGQTAAMAAGIEAARGAVLITMDGDLQNDPADIPRFLEKINEGFDIVVGWRHDRKDRLISRKIPSRVANWMIGKVTGVPIKDNGCSLKAFRARIIKQVPLYADMHRFIPAMASIAGPRLAEIKVRHHARRFGESKYGLSRIHKVLLDMLTVKTIVSFSSRPLAWFMVPAIPFLLVSMATLTASLYRVIVLDEAFSTVIAGVGVLFGALGLFLVFTGMFAELIYKTRDNQVERLSILTAESLLIDTLSGPSRTPKSLT